MSDQGNRPGIVNLHLRLTVESHQKFRAAAARVGVPTTALFESWVAKRATKLHEDHEVAALARKVHEQRMRRPMNTAAARRERQQNQQEPNR